MPEDHLKELANGIGKEFACELWEKVRAGNIPIFPEYLTPQEAAALTGHTVKALERLRQQSGKGPRYFKIGVSVRYKPDDLRAWIESGGPQQ